MNDVDRCALSCRDRREIAPLRGTFTHVTHEERRQGEDATNEETQRQAHIPVLLGAVTEHLTPAIVAAYKAGRVPVYADCTAGLGGHAVSVISAAQSAGVNRGVVVLCDLDADNLARSEASVRGATHDGWDVVCHHASFVELPRRLTAAGLAADAVLADLGFASTQIDDPQRGLSFRREGPLDMRFDRTAPTTAAQLVNTLSESELADLFFDFGEERRGRAIAAGIVRARQNEPIETTTHLASIVRDVLGGTQRPASRRGSPGIDPATKTFQALRIAVNDELAALDALLEAVQRGCVTLRAGNGPAGSDAGWLCAGSHIGMISFHSLEDRRVKRAFAALVDRSLADILTRKPVGPDFVEEAMNPRSRSAKLRVARIAGG